MLLEALGRIGHVDAVHAAGLVAAFGLFLWASLLPSLAARSGQAPMPPRAGSRFAFYAAAIAFIAWGRLPTLLPPILNPDEGLFTAAAARLLQDPVFWRSADTGSSGPLNVFPLTLAALAGFFPDFSTSRVVGIAFIAGSACLLHAALSRAYPDRTARLAVVPVAATVALLSQNHFVHYSSEHGPIFLLSLMLFLIYGIGAQGGDDGRAAMRPVFLVGLCAGLMPYTKLQGLPMAAALCAILVHLLWRRNRRDAAATVRQLAVLAAGAVIPTLIVALYLTAFSIWSLFWDSYIGTNFVFYSGMSSKGTFGKLRNFLGLVHYAVDLHWLLGLTAIACVAGLAAAVLRGRRQAAAPASGGWRPPYVAYALAYLLAAVFSIFKPGNPFIHYVLFLVMPTGLLAGTILGEADRRRALQVRHGAGRAVPRLHALLAAAFVASAFLPLAVRLHDGSRYLADSASYRQNYRSPIAASVLRIAPPGASMTVWGFSPEIYVDSRLVQSTRYGVTTPQSESNPHQDKFLKEFVEELQASPPLVFVDAMARGMFYVRPIEPAKHRHEAFRDVSEIVRSGYELVDDVKGVRIYRRKKAL